MTAEPIAGSFRDPSGFLYSRDGLLLRQINSCYADDFDALIGSGLYDALTSAKLLVEHAEAEIELAYSTEAYKIIAPVQIPFVSYPYEWSFGQLKDAALTTLEIQKQALDKGMSLKDASAYNIQFLNGQPIFIDTLSFEKYQEGSTWVAYRQFCQHFLAPLALMAHSDIGLNQLFRTNIDGVPLDLTIKLLPYLKRFNPTLMIHLWLHSRSQNKAHEQRDSTQAVTGSFSDTAFRGLLDSLSSGIAKLNWKPGGTEWFDYYETNNNYGDTGLAEKEALVARVVKQISPKSVWDLGGNTGRFTRIATQSGAAGVCFDIDPGCVESNYQFAKSNRDGSVLPLLLDLTNPSPGIGWAGNERFSLQERGPVDLILALGLIHHLVIANNVPFAKVAELLEKLCQHLVIEFIPRGDSQIDKLLLNRRDVFAEYETEAFEQVFSQHFKITESTPIPDTHRILYVMESRSRDES